MAGLKLNSSGGGSALLDPGSTASNLTFTFPTASGQLVATGAPFSGGTANGVVYLNGSSVPVAGSALTFDGTNFSTTGSATATGFIPSGSSAPTNGLYLPAANTPAWSSNSTKVLSVIKGSSLALEGTTPQTGTGISFPATQSASSDANTLDDYEEGTWTPSLGGNATYTVQDGKYTKVGKLVTVTCVLIVNAIGTGSLNGISGLPFATTTNSQGSVAYWNSLSTSLVFLAPFVDTNGTTTVYWKTATAATSGTGQANIFQNGSRVDWTMTYFAS